MNQGFAFLDRQSKTFIILLSLGLLTILTLLDRVTGYEISFSIVYLVPIILVTQFGNLKLGGLFSVAAAGLWLWADLAAGQTYSTPAIPYWNALVRFGFFSIITILFHERKQQQILQDELSAFIVHDLHSPLASLTMGLETMVEAEGDLADPYYQELILLSLTSAHRLMGLINSLLDLRRLETHKMPIVHEQFAVLTVIQRVFAQANPWIKRLGIDLQYQLDSSDMTVKADPVLVERILVNLVSNSIKFSEPNSSIAVQVTAVDADKVMFRIMDEGQGIPAEWRDKVFDKYAQVEARRSNNSSGTGLGLTFCREAVEAQHGSIWVEANRPKGTTIAFVLPGQQ